MAKAEDYFVGIDVGSSKVAVLIGKRDPRGGLEVAGRGQAPNRGMRRGQHRQPRGDGRGAAAPRARRPR